MKKSRISRLISNLLTVLLILIMTALLFISIAPRFFGMHSYYIKSESMEPAIGYGSLVLTEKVSFEDINPGDVITFQSKDGETRFTHRIADINTRTQELITKGDANRENDRLPTKYSNVLGRVKYTIPFVGFITIFANAMYGKIIIAAFLLIWIGTEIEIFRTKRKSPINEQQELK